MSEIRAYAALTLARMQANSAEVVAALMRLLDDPETGVREHAGIALAAGCQRDVTYAPCLAPEWSRTADGSNC